MFRKSLSVASVCFVALAAATLSKPAGALVIYNNWNYAIDAQDDGSPSSGGAYEYRGMAFRILGNTAYVALSGGMPLGGNAQSGALNGRASHGDLFFNFSSHNLDTAAEFNDPGVFGIRFDASNDSFNNVGGSQTTLGVFSNLSVVGLAGVNSGYGSLSAYNNAGWGRTTDAMADLESTTGDVAAYLGTGAQFTHIQSGSLLGGITLLDRNALSGLGVDFAHFNANSSGAGVFGFSFSSSLLPRGDFTAHVFEECINDGMALRGSTSVPEPGAYALLGSGLLALGAFAGRRRRRK